MPFQENLLVPCLRVLHQPATYVDKSWLAQTTDRALPQVLTDAQLRQEKSLLAGDVGKILEDDIGNLLVRYWYALPDLAAMLNTWLWRSDIVGRNLLHTLPLGHRALLHLPISPPPLPPTLLPATSPTAPRREPDPSHGMLSARPPTCGIHALVYCANAISQAFGQRVAIALPKQSCLSHFVRQDIMKIRSALKFSACYVAQN